MGKKPNVLCIDIGADTLKASEFSYSQEGTMELLNFVFTEFGYTDSAMLENADSSVEMLLALKNLFAEHTFSAKLVNVSLSAHNALIRFVKIPALTENEEKVRQIIEFEARQNAPLPVDQMILDYQLTSSSEDGSEIDAMIVNVKSADIEKIVKVIQDAGKKIGTIEVAPTASYNACRANMVGEENCEMILNIGGRCSTLIFIDQGSYFERTLAIAGNTITQQISKEFGVSLKEAEDLKRRHGFVALGGAYEDPESEVAAIISKIIRNVMTRLHGEINRSINLYRAQQKGRKPEKLYLAGGSSVMTYTPRFFSEKLKVPVEYLNPFQVIGIADDVDKDALSEVAHVFSEVIGLGLRNVGTCPLEISLIPEPLKRERIFNQKQPFFYASAVTMLLCLGITFWSFSKQLVTVKKDQIRAEQQVSTTKSIMSKVDAAYSKLNSMKSAYSKATELLVGRETWPELLNKIQKATLPEIWFTSVEGASALVITKKNEPAPETGGFRGFGAFESAGSQQTSAVPTGEYKWIVFNGYIRTDNPKAEATHIYEKFKQNLEKTGVFKKFTIADSDRMIKNFKLAPQDSNISSFRIEAELLTPIKR